MADHNNDKENYNDLIFDWGSFDKYVPGARKTESRSREDIPGEDTADIDIPAPQPEEPEHPVLKKGDILKTKEKVSIINLADLLEELKADQSVSQGEETGAEGEPAKPAAAPPKKVYTDPEELLALDDSEPVPFRHDIPEPDTSRYDRPEPEPDTSRYDRTQTAETSSRPERPGKRRETFEQPETDMTASTEEPEAELELPDDRESSSDRREEAGTAGAILSSAGSFLGRIRDAGKSSGGFSGWLQKVGLSGQDEEETEEAEEAGRKKPGRKQEPDVLDMEEDEPDDDFEKIIVPREKEERAPEEASADSQEDISPGLQTELSHAFQRIRSAIKKEPDPGDIDGEDRELSDDFEPLDAEEEDEAPENQRFHNLYGEGHAPAAEKERPDIIQILTLGVLVAIAVMCIVDLFGILTRGLGGGGGDQPAEAVRETRPQVVITQDNIEESIQQAYLTVNPFSRPAVAMDGVRGIVVHDSEMPGKTAMEVRDAYEALAQTQAERASCHYVVGLYGEIVACVPDNEIAYASNARNMDTISVAFCSEDDTGAYSDITYQSLVQLCARLCRTYQINGVDILRHYDINSQNCPKAFVADDTAWMRFRTAVTAVAAGEPIPSEEDTADSADSSAAAESEGDGTVTLPAETE